jgi:predicted RNase H-like nuclease (RuvC/YqgF family)
MLTEEEAVVQLNERVSKNNIKDATKRFLVKIKKLQGNLELYQAEIEKLEKQKKSIEKEVERTKGAISVLLELAAEDEGMLAEISNGSSDQ